MPIDPNIILQAGNVKPLDYGQLAGTALGQIGQQQEMAYRRDQMAANARQQAAAERKQATLQRAGKMAAAGDVTGAQKETLEDGDFDAYRTISSFNDDQKKALKAKADAVGSIAATAMQYPYAVRRQIIAASADNLKAAGWTDEDIAKFDPTDQTLAASVANVQSVNDVFTRIDRDRTYNAGREDAGATQQYRRDSLGVQMRGQNMTDARAREAAARAGGSAPGAPVKTTEAERTAGFLANRLAGALTDISGAVANDKNAAAPGIGETIAGFFGDTAGNASRTADRQQVVAAQMDALDSALTLGTGAAYTTPQLESYRQSYFPQVGDAASTVRGKKVRFVRLLESAAVKAGNATPPALVAAIEQGKAELAASAPKPKAAPVAGGKITTGKDGVRTWTPR